MILSGVCRFVRAKLLRSLNNLVKLLHFATPPPEKVSHFATV